MRVRISKLLRSEHVGAVNRKPGRLTLRGALALMASAAVVATYSILAPALGLGASPSASAADAPGAASSADCSSLAITGECDLTYAQLGSTQTTVAIPSGVNTITVLLSGGTGGGGEDQGLGGPGGLTIAQLNMSGASASRSLDVWLAESGRGESSGGNGWVNGGAGGTGGVANSGNRGGGASAIAWTGSGHDNPLVVAGGGGGGGAWGKNPPNERNAGGMGGAGGFPATDGTPGTFNGENGDGGSGGDAGHPSGGTGDGSHNIEVTAGGGGGGGGYPDGGGGGGLGAFGQDNGHIGTGGGGGGGQSFVSPGRTGAAGAALKGYTTAAWGDGSLTIIAGPAYTFLCGTHAQNPRSFELASLVQQSTIHDVAFVAAGGSGDRLHNVTQAGSGAVVSGSFDPSGIDTLNIWPGCSASSHGGAGYGGTGGGGSAPARSANNGGDAGGASMIQIAQTSTPLAAAGGGGGTGGDASDVTQTPDCQVGGDDADECGGAGGSAGGTAGGRYEAYGANGADHGGTGGCDACRGTASDPNPNGGDGSDGSRWLGGGGGGGGGAGYPRAGHGGGSSEGPGGGGGAGGSYVAPTKVTGGQIYASGNQADGFVTVIPKVIYDTSLTITKTVTGAAAADYGKGPFTVHVTCTIGTTTLIDQTVTLLPNGSHTFDDVQQTADCTIEEVNTGGATVPAPSQEVQIGSDPMIVDLSNEFDFTDLTFTMKSQIVDGNGDPVTDVGITLGELGLNVACSLNDATLQLGAPVVDGVLSFAGQDTWSSVTATVPKVPVGADCSVSQVAGSGAASVRISVDGAILPVDSEFTTGSGKTAVEVDDSYLVAPLTITKKADGNGTPPDGAEYGGTVSCTWGGHPVTLPASAVFNVEVDGTDSVPNLPVGAQCTLDETSAGSAVAVHYTPSRTITITDAPVAAAVVTNTFDTGALQVAVGTSGDGADFSNAGFSVTVECTIGSSIVLQDKATLPASGGVLSYAPDVNATCSVEETARGGASAVYYATGADPTRHTSPVSVVIAVDASQTLTVDNEFAAAPLQAATSTTGAGARFAQPTQVVIGACSFNGLPIDVLPGKAQEQFILPASGGQASIARMPVGALCQITEVDAGGATATTYAVADGDPSSAVPGGLSVTVNPSSAPTTVSFTNAFGLGALAVTETVDGAAKWAANTDFNVDVQCLFNGKPMTVLGPNGTVTLAFQPDGTPIANPASMLLSALPVGADCSAVQTAGSSASMVVYDPAGADAGSAVVEVAPGGSHIAIRSTFDASSLVVATQLIGNDAAAHADTAFLFDGLCTFNGKILPPPPSDPNRSGAFSITGADSTILGDLPVGAHCDVAQIQGDHATQVTPSRDQSAVLGADPAQLVFTSAFDTTSLAVSETLIGDGAVAYGQPQTFNAIVRCVTSGERGGWVPLAGDGEVALSQANGFAQTLQVPVNVTCRVTQGSQMASELSLPAPTNTHAGETTRLPITARFDLGTIAVSKQAHGTGAATEVFGFELRCRWVSGRTHTALALADGSSGDFALRSGGTYDVQALSGASCTVNETDSGGAIRVVATATGRNATVSGSVVSASVSATVPIAAAYTNFLPGTLPLTGSELNGALGIVLLLLGAGGALALIARLRRRRSRA